MGKVAMVAMVALLSAVPGWGQDQSDSQMLIEMRGIHNDVRLSETTQILLTELEIQQTAVTRAMQKRDDAKNRVTQLQENEKNFAAQVARFDDLANTTTDAQQKKQFAQQVDQLKSQLTLFKTQETDRANDLLDTENALRKEQDALQGIQDQLNDVVKKLQPVSRE